jgi:hypothetical protein
MTEMPEAAEADLVEQSQPVDDGPAGTAALPEESEAEVADLLEQAQPLPPAEDYPHGEIGEQQ